MQCLMSLCSRCWVSASSGSARGRISELMLSKGATSALSIRRESMSNDARLARFYEPPLQRQLHKAPNCDQGRNEKGSPRYIHRHVVWPNRHCPPVN